MKRGSDEMTESSGFRSSLRGFRRQDVLNYIDDLQEEHRQRELRLQKGLVSANQMLRDLSDEVDRLRASLEESGSECDRLRESLQQTGEECTRLKEEVARAEEREETYAEQSRECRRQAEAYEAARSQLLAAQQRLSEIEELRRREAAEQAETSAEAERRRLEAEETRARYDALTQDMTRYAEELRARGKEFLDTSCRQGATCLDDVEQTVDTLQSHLLDVRRRISDTRGRLEEKSAAAGLKLDEWTREVSGQETDPPKAAPAESPKPADNAASSSGDVLERLMSGSGGGSLSPRRVSSRATGSADRNRDGVLRRWLDGFFGI
ncbi:MAG: hypothetical protein IKI63_00795 [Clostridia bacterium]|nr:hypothetical protein [Clostridia bacterium]